MPRYFLGYNKKGHMHTKISGPAGYHIGAFNRTLILMGPADKGGAGGAGGAGAGGAGGAGNNDEPPPPLNEAQTAAVGKIVNDAVNGAVTNHLTRFKKQFGEEIGKTLTDSLAPIGEQLKTLAERGAQQGAGGAGGTGGGQPNPFEAQIRSMEAKYEGQIRELKAANDAEKSEREKERQIRMRDEERGMLTDSLRTSGLPDTMIKAAVALLHGEEKRIGRTDDGRIVFRTEKGTGAARYTDEQDMAVGVAEWLKTDDGKSFVPARPAQGAGGQATRPGARPGSPAEAKAQAAADLARVLMGGGTV